PAAWESEEIAELESGISIAIPPLLEVGGAYRVRSRMKDSSGRWSHWSPPLEFIVGPPTAPFPAQADLRITELMYHPSGGSDFEFVEILNTGDSLLDLSLVSFTAGIEFSFAQSDVAALFPGEYAVVVKNRTAFEALYDTSGMLVAGEYSGSLENAGELVALTFGANQPILSVEYDDRWHPETDGLGYSLEIADPHAPAQSWNDSASWMPSQFLHGTPGLPPSGIPEQGGLQRPGDANQDAEVDISDAILLLLHLFGGSHSPLPCEGSSPGEGGNLALLDASGDGAVDITDAIHILGFLFRGGSPPFAGTGCIRIEGCPNRCGLP
ncbi:MAG: lamin tail domain-containing protein, partial [Planctomycetes bacterium]|nr:lamin tail domain-containing protein [Planctomycetota bacterium]